MNMQEHQEIEKRAKAPLDMKTPTFGDFAQAHFDCNRLLAEVGDLRNIIVFFMRYGGEPQVDPRQGGLTTAQLVIMGDIASWMQAQEMLAAQAQAMKAAEAADATPPDPSITAGTMDKFFEIVSAGRPE
jgi:hypothetical protein